MPFVDLLYMTDHVVYDWLITWSKVDLLSWDSMSALAKFRTSLNRPHSGPSTSSASSSRSSSVDPATLPISVLPSNLRRAQEDDSDEGGLLAPQNAKRLKTLANDACRLHKLLDNSLDMFITVSIINLVHTSLMICLARQPCCYDDRHKGPSNRSTE